MIRRKATEIKVKESKQIVTHDPRVREDGTLNAHPPVTHILAYRRIHIGARAHTTLVDLLCTLNWIHSMKMQTYNNNNSICECITCVEISFICAVTIHIYIQYI